jgi:hypothetical protein
MDAAASKANAMPIDPLSTSLADDPRGEMTLIKTWARATALTPMEMWDQKFAFKKLSHFSNDQLQNAIDILIEEKVVIRRPRGKSTTGRSFEGSEAFIAPLRRPIAATVFVEALAYKNRLDTEFRAGREVILVDYMGDEGSYMCISSLQASGQLHLKYINIPDDPMGMGDDAHPYDTKRMPKAKIKWDIEMRRTPSYFFNDESHLFRGIHGAPAPRLSDSQVIPPWYTIAEELYPDMWKRILVAVSITVALRTGVSNDTLKMLFKPTLEDWEVDMLMEWGQLKGFWESIDQDEDGEQLSGWVATRDWWLLLAVVVEEMDGLTKEMKDNYEARRRKRTKRVDGEADDGSEDDEDAEMDYAENDDLDDEANVETPADQDEEEE